MTAALDWRHLIAVHPAADLFPMLPDAELDALAKDIDQDGLRVPLSLWRAHEGADWQLLDGRNRLDALARLPDGEDRISGAFATANRYEGERTNPLAFVVSANILRRHLDAEQKRGVIAALLKADPTRSNRSIGGLAAADHKTAGNVRKELEGRGEIPHVSARTDSVGRQQPAHKPPVQRQPPAALVHDTTPRPASVSKEQQLRSMREDRASTSAAAALPDRYGVADELEQVLRILRGDRGRIAQIPLAKRVELARGCMKLLDVTLGDLGPIGRGP